MQHLTDFVACISCIACVLIACSDAAVSEQCRVEGTCQSDLSAPSQDKMAAAMLQVRANVSQPALPNRGAKAPHDLPTVEMLEELLRREQAKEIATPSEAIGIHTTDILQRSMVTEQGVEATKASQGQKSSLVATEHRRCRLRKHQ